VKSASLSAPKSAESFRCTFKHSRTTSVHVGG